MLRKIRSNSDPYFAQFTGRYVSPLPASEWVFPGIAFPSLHGLGDLLADIPRRLLAGRQNKSPQHAPHTDDPGEQSQEVAHRLTSFRMKLPNPQRKLPAMHAITTVAKRFCEHQLRKAIRGFTKRAASVGQVAGIGVSHIPTPAGRKIKAPVGRQPGIPSLWRFLEGS